MVPRMGKRGRPVCGFILAVASTLISSAGAQESGAPQSAPLFIHIQNSHPCFDQERFLRDLRSRLPEKQVELTRDNAQAEVQVLRHEQGYQASLVLHSSGSATRPRVITSPTCDEATEGIAFITSVALEDQRQTAQSPSHAPVQESAVPQQKAWEMRAAVGAQLAVDVLPKTTAGPLLSVFGGRRRAGFWSPGIELGFLILPAVHVTQPAGVARFSQWHFTLDLCPTQGRVRAFWLRPCAYAAAGRLRSEGRETENGQLRHRPYLTAGAEVVLGVDLGRWVDLIVRGSWSAALIVDSYQLGDEIFYKQDPFNYGLGAQVSVTLF